MHRQPRGYTHRRLQPGRCDPVPPAHRGLLPVHKEQPSTEGNSDGDTESGHEVPPPETLTHNITDYLDATITRPQKGKRGD